MTWGIYIQAENTHTYTARRAYIHTAKHTNRQTHTQALPATHTYIQAYIRAVIQTGRERQRGSESERQTDI